MTDQPADGESQAPTPAPAQPPAAEWLSYREAADRLGIDPAAVAARARRGRWPKRRRNEPPNAAEVLVPAELLAAGPQEPQERENAPAPSQEAPDIAGIVQASIAPLTDALARTDAERKALQVEANGLRDQLAAAQLATARASGESTTERVKREAAEAKAKDLQDRLDKVLAQFDAMQAEARKPKPRRPWWKF
jgi:hypothetical protein